MSQVVVASHPLIQHHLAQLRDVNTPPAEFRLLVQRLAALLAYEATRDLPLADCTFRTPLVETTGRRITGRIGLVPILRAGLGMVEPVLNFIPGSEVWHLGLYRDEATAQAIEYYSKLPPGDPVDMALVLDPMLATGGSVVAALESLGRWGVPRLKVLALIVSQQGIDNLLARFPHVQFYVCAIDPELNSQKYIVPGLGDAGDRIFNTQAK